MADVSIDRILIAKINELDDAQKLRVLEFVEELNASGIDLEKWLEQATAFREDMVRKYGKDHFFGVQQALDEVREEASWPRGS